MRPSMTLISLCIHPVKPDPSACAHLIAKYPIFLPAATETRIRLDECPETDLSFRWGQMPQRCFCYIASHFYVSQGVSFISHRKHFYPDLSKTNFLPCLLYSNSQVIINKVKSKIYSKIKLLISVLMFVSMCHFTIKSVLSDHPFR